MKSIPISFIGLGRMGSNMARCLQEKGYSIAAVYDIDPSLTRQIASELHCTPAESARTATEAAQIIFTVVTNDAAMQTLFFADEGLAKIAQGRLFINCATLAPDTHRTVASALESAGGQCLEASMASSIPQARKGELFLMIGGQPEVFERNRPILEDLSKALHYIGPAGKAAEVKALVNMVMNIHTAALAEGLGLGQALGLDLGTLCAIFSQTGANSRVLETDAGDMIHRDHDCFFSAEHAAKDSKIALDLASAQGISTPLAAATLVQYEKMVALGLGGLDKSGIAELTFPGRGPQA